MRRIDTLFSTLGLHRVTYDFPSVGSNATVLDDVTMSGAAIGDMIISWSADSDATEIDDLIIQFLVVATDTVRATLTNPTGGAIDPGSIDLILFVGRPNPLIDP